MARKNEMFQLRMSAETKDHLTQLSEWDDCSMAEAARDAIEAAWRQRLAIKLAMEKKPRL